MGQLDGKVVIVTGSTTGIGEATARACVAAGASVLVHGRDEAAGRAVVESLGDAAALQVDDLADAEAPQRIVDAAVDAFGKVSGVVNNAAWVVRSELHNTDANLFDRAMAINVRAPMLMVKAALPHLKRSRGGVVNIGSVTAYCGEPRQLAYAVSKGALVTLSRNLANVLAADGVRVNHLNVGWTLTPNEYKLKMTEGLPENWPDLPMPSDVPFGRMTRPEEVANHVVFWLSDASGPISGTVADIEQHPVIGRIPLKEGDGD